MFETNANSSRKQVIEIIERLKTQGYRLLSEGENTVVELITPVSALLKPKVIMFTETIWALGRISREIVNNTSSCDLRFLGWETPIYWKSVLSSNDFQLLVVQTLGSTSKILQLYPQLAAKLIAVCHGPIEYSDTWPHQPCIDNSLDTGLPVGGVSEEIVSAFSDKGLNSFLTPCGVNTKLFIPTKSPDSSVFKVLFPRLIPQECHFEIKRTELVKLVINHYKNNESVVVECLDRRYSMGEMPSIYNKYDAILILSKSEGNPLALLEGGACGAISISTSVGIVPSVIVDGVDGFIITGETDEELRLSTISIIDMLDKNRDLLHSAQAAIAKKIHIEHSWDKKGAYWDSFFLEALRRINY
jgi:hypothetical protein